MKKKYEYLVAYNFNMPGYLTHCTGSVQIFRDKKIKSYEDLSDICKAIGKAIEGATNISVYNFIYLGKKKVTNKGEH